MSIFEKLKAGIASLLASTEPLLADNEIKPDIEEKEMPAEMPKGLSSAEVDEQIALGNVNYVKDTASKSYMQIIGENLLTFFNFIWAIMTLVLVLFESYTNLTYLFIVVPNILIATVQQIRAKRTVEKLSVTTDPKATVVRDDQLWDIDSREIVIGEIMRVDMGRQVLSDATVVSGICEANESMITGESEPIKKQVGDRLLAGSFLVSGSVYAKVDRVGKDNYVYTLEKEAKHFKAPSSNLFRDLNRLIRFIGGFIIPTALLMLICNWLFYKGTLADYELLKTVVVKTCGSIAGMIPAGIYLLVTLTLSLSVIALGKKKALVQDMYSIEMLASADVLCLDKTGTITDGTMEVSFLKTVAKGVTEERVSEIMSYLSGDDTAVNATARAFLAYFGRKRGEVVDSIPFSSARKYSATHIEDVGCFAVGAPHFVPCDITAEMEEVINERAKLGERVLVLAELPDLATRGRAVALISLADRIRPSAKDTIARFQSQGVTVKVISGDHAATVSAIAQKVGITGAEKYISCEDLTDDELCDIADEYAIFGRVTPEQKVLLVKTFKKKGHTVAMTGDGVNDTLALKEANCAIAMADGSEVAAQVSQIVLLNSDFSSLPAVVNEGRKCVNNVRQSAVLYLMKTIFTIFISLFSIITLSGYPFDPNNFLFLEFFVIGIGSFAMALEPNSKRIEGSFLDRVLVKAFPCAVAMFVPTLLILVVGKFSNAVAVESRNAVAMCVVTLVGYLNLIYTCRPFTRWRLAVATLVGGLLAGGIVIGVVAETVLIRVNIFGFSHVLDNPVFFFFMLGLGLALTVVMQFFREQLERWFDKIGKDISAKVVDQEVK